MECKFCKNKFKSISSLHHHQKTARYCLILQGHEKPKKYSCSECKKTFTTKQNLTVHQSSCKKTLIQNIISRNDLENVMMKQKIKDLEKALSRNDLENVMMKQKIKDLEKALSRKDLENVMMKQKIKDLEKALKDQLRNSREQISCLQKALENCALEAINQQKDKKKANEIRIKYLEKKYLKKQKRIEYKEKNVIYILTTNLMQKERRYIMGKATNLTNRLSTYNKSDEHVVIYFQECPDKEIMDIVETVIFQKLKKFREKANRERFILPHDKEITFFQDMIHKCIEFQI